MSSDGCCKAPRVMPEGVSTEASPGGKERTMSYEATGLMALFPVYLERMGREEDLEAVNSRIAQNENNLNQDLSILYNKLLELEAALAAQEQG